MLHDETHTCDDARLLEWASNFIEEIARGEHPDLGTLDHLTFEQRVALAEFVDSAMEHDDPQVRSAGAWVAIQIEVMTEDSPELLRSLLHDPVDEVRRAAAWAFSRMPDAALVALDDLVEMLHDPDDGVRLAAVEALAQVGEPARVAIPLLLDIARTGAEVLRGFATKALSLIAPEMPEVREILIQCLTTNEIGDSLFATWGLGLAGESSAPAAPLIITSLKSRDDSLVLLSGGRWGGWEPSNLIRYPRCSTPSRRAAGRPSGCRRAAAS